MNCPVDRENSVHVVDFMLQQLRERAFSLQGTRFPGFVFK
jgi:hypothetical protein